MHNLLFFVLALTCACTSDKKTGIHILWENNKAKSIGIPKKMTPGFNNESIATFLKIRLLNDSIDILGNYRVDNEIIFEPLIPFPPGFKYEVFYRNKMLGRFEVPVADTSDAPQLVAVYPQQDTLPENLLKWYFQFSKPMREGLSDQYIRLIKNGTDTLQDVFLNLQPELWNEDRTVITVWLDPGRIKRNLQPNQRLGAPLQQTGKYQLLVSKQWKDAQGVNLENDFKKLFIIGTRDSLSPDPGQWKIQTPKEGSLDPLIIILTEPLDHFLLLESMRISNTDGSVINGKFFVEKKDTYCRFIPAIPWVARDYQVIIEPKLEDLAGNNLNRIFDRDITKTKSPATKNDYRRIFRVTH